MIKGVGLEGAMATALEQVGYSLADVVAKAVFGVLIWRIAHEKTLAMEDELAGYASNAQSATKLKGLLANAH